MAELDPGEPEVTVGFYPDVRPIAVDCPECEKHVVARPKGYFTNLVSDFESPRYETETQRWALLACESLHPILVVEDEDRRIAEYGTITYMVFDPPYRIYPPQDRVLSPEIPAALRQGHDEARRCIRAKSYMAAAVMSGRVLEGVCKLNGVIGRGLQAKLIAMKENGLIDGRLWEWAEALRGVRNAAAHFGDSESISKQDAEDLVAFTEALLDYLYVLTARFNALKERRAMLPEPEGDVAAPYDCPARLPQPVPCASGEGNLRDPFVPRFHLLGPTRLRSG